MSDEEAKPESLEWIDSILGIVSFLIMLLNLIALYADMVRTLHYAPQQMRDSFGNLRQQLAEEREALMHQMRQSRLNQELERQQQQQQRRRRSSQQPAMGTLPLTYPDQTLLLHYNTLKGLWLRYKELERPFLADDDERAEAAMAKLERDDSWNTADFRGAHLHRDPHRNYPGQPDLALLGPADFKSLYRCDFVHRFIWWQVKPDVKSLGEKVVKIMMRRMEREVTQTRLMLMQNRGIEFKFDGFYHNTGAAAVAAATAATTVSSQAQGGGAAATATRYERATVVEQPSGYGSEDELLRRPPRAASETRHGSRRDRTVRRSDGHGHGRQYYVTEYMTERRGRRRSRHD